MTSCEAALSQHHLVTVACHVLARICGAFTSKAQYCTSCAPSNVVLVLPVCDSMHRF